MEKSALEKKISEHMDKIDAMLKAPTIRGVAFTTQHSYVQRYIKDLEKLGVNCSEKIANLEKRYKQYRAKTSR